MKITNYKPKAQVKKSIGLMTDKLVKQNNVRNHITVYLHQKFPCNIFAKISWLTPTVQFEGKKTG